MKVFLRKGKPWLCLTIFPSGNDSRGTDECCGEAFQKVLLSETSAAPALLYRFSVHVQGTERHR